MICVNRNGIFFHSLMASAYFGLSGFNSSSLVEGVQ